MRRNSKKNDSKKIFFIATIIAAIIFSASIYLLKSSSKDIVVAKINDQKIFKSEVEKKLSDFLSGQNQAYEKHPVESLSEEILTVLIKEIYLEKEITAQAKKSKIANSAEVKEKVADVENRIIRQAYVDSLINSEVSDEKINNKYLELSKELDGKKEYLISHIVLKTKEEAEKIYKELNGKKVPASKFAELAKKYSIDQESSAKGGNLDYILEDNLIKEIADTVGSLKKDEISSPIETKFGWHLIKIGDIREAKALSFELVKDSIKDQLVQDQINNIHSKIIENAKIKILIKLEDKSAKPAEGVESIPNNVTPAEVKAEEVEAAPAEIAPTEAAPTKIVPAKEAKIEAVKKDSKKVKDKSEKTSEKTKKTKKESDAKDTKHKTKQ